MSVLSNRRQFSVSPVPKMNLKNISVLSDLRCLPQGPGPALCLGVAGLIPFVTAPLYMANSGYFLPDIATAQLAYGASILSFLGGVRWGMLVSGTGDDLPPSWAQFTWSVTPSLIAWTAVLVPSLIGGNVLCISGLLAAGVMDLSTKSYPPWFRGLRFLLTFCAVFSLVATSVFSYSLGSKKQPSDYLT